MFENKTPYIFKYLNTYKFNNSSVKINFKIGKLGNTGYDIRR